MEQQKSYVKNAADKEQVKSAKFKERNRRNQELKDVIAVMDMPAGRRFIWRYLEKCGVYRQSYTGNSETFFREGSRSIGLNLLGDIMDANPELYVKLIQENRSKENA